MAPDRCAKICTTYAYRFLLLEIYFCNFEVLNFLREERSFVDVPMCYKNKSVVVNTQKEF